MQPRGLDKLVNERESALPGVMEVLTAGTVPFEVLPCERSQGASALVKVQVTTKSPMGAIVFGTAGILLDHGWIRFLGAGGHKKLARSLPDWSERAPDGSLIFADDVLGGQFALNGGAFDGELGDVYYRAPDTLEWESLEIGFSDFLSWAVEENALSKFYESSRWPGWEAEVEALGGDQALNVYPFLFTAGPPIAERSRSPVPVQEQFALMMSLRSQLLGTGA